MKYLISLSLLIATPVMAVEPLSQEDMKTVVIPPPGQSQTSPGGPVASESTGGESAGTSSEASSESDSYELNRAPGTVVENMEGYTADTPFSVLLADALSILSHGSGVDFDLKMSGFHYDESATNTVHPDGSFSLAIPSLIDRISLENIRVQDGRTPPMGDVHVRSIELNNSSVTVTPR